MTMTLIAKNKLCFVDKSIPQPTNESAPEFKCMDLLYQHGDNSCWIPHPKRELPLLQHDFRLIIHVQILLLDSFINNWSMDTNDYTYKVLKINHILLAPLHINIPSSDLSLLVESHWNVDVLYCSWELTNAALFSVLQDKKWD